MQIICVFLDLQCLKVGPSSVGLPYRAGIVGAGRITEIKIFSSAQTTEATTAQSGTYRNSYKKWNDLEHVNKNIFLLKYGAYKVSFIGGTGVGSDMWMGGGRGDTFVLQNRETCIKTSFVTAGTVLVLSNQWMHKYSFVSFI